MKKFLLLAAAGIAALASALPATAGTVNFRGVVVAKNPVRKTIVTVSRSGMVRTIRARGALRRTPVGRIVAVRAATLPDGTFAAARIRPLGKAGRARFRATVVAVRGASLAVSAGGSVLALRLRAGKTGSSTGDGLRAGDEIDLEALVRHGSLQTRGDRLRKLGHSDQLELEGIYFDTADDGAIELAVVHHGRVFVRVPADVFVPDSQAGDEIVAVVTVAADGSFTLVEAANESSDDDDGGGGVNGDGTFTVVGFLASLSPDLVSVTVEEENHEPVRCAVPDGFDLSGFEIGQQVLMRCKYGDGHPVLLTLERHDESDYLTVTGPITVLTDESVTVQGDGDPVECAVPEEIDLSDFEVGDVVIMACAKIDDVWTLKAIELKSDPPPPPPDYVLVDGSIDALSAETITVEGDGDPVTCAVPEGADLSGLGFHVDDDVSMKCVRTDAGLTLKRLQSDSALYEAP